MGIRLEYWEGNKKAALKAAFLKLANLFLLVSEGEHLS